MIEKTHPYWHEQRFLIISHQVNRLGDLSCGFKVANALHEGRGIPCDHIMIGTNVTQNALHFNKYNFSVLTYAQVEKVQNITLQIIIPASSEGDAMYFLKNGVSTLVVYENGFTCPPNPPISEEYLISRSMGLNLQKKEIGVFIDQELCEWSFSDHTAHERIQKLLEATPSLREAIFGDTKDFINSNLLYLGYAAKPDSQRQFVHTIIALNKDNNKNLTIVLPGKYYRDLFDAEFDVGKLIVKESTAVVLEKLVKTSGKVLTIITGYVKYTDIRYLLMASEKETITTGDHSPAEAASANKSWIYEQEAHKNDYAMSLDMIKDPRALKFTLPSPRAHQMLQIFHANRQDNFRSVTVMNRTICEKFNCTHKIDELIGSLIKARSLSTKPPFERLPQNFKPTEIPFDTVLLMTLEQISSLRIDVRTNRSSLDGLEQSVFQCRSLTLGYFLVKRLNR